MYAKPFKPPLLRKTPSPQPGIQSENEEPPAKKRRVSAEELEAERTELTSKHPPNPSKHVPWRKPLLSINKPVIKEDPESSQPGPRFDVYYKVLWRKPSGKKHKTWDGDGHLAVVNSVATLEDEDGRQMGRTKQSGPLLSGSTLSVGGKEVEVDSIISKEAYLSGRRHPQTKEDSAPKAPTAREQTFKQPAIRDPPVRELEEPERTNVRFNSKREQSEDRKAPLKHAAPQTIATQSAFKNPLLEKTTMPKTSRQDATPRHDPKARGAVVMKRPQLIPRGKQVVDVVVDPFISKSLRDHQKEGVKFMYESVMGMKSHGGEGAILADEMGLGKTLQVIALLWTLMKQNPIYEDQPPVKKALIVCPVTLIKNWRKEFRKWLGDGRLGIFVVTDKKARLTDFTHGKAYNVMIIGYEKLRMVQEDLQKGAGVDIVIADEGHRLKTAQNKSAQAIKSLNTERRVILSGTPLQNDLSEFYFMVDFVNPGLLGKANAFKRQFESPILKSRQPDATEKEIEKGNARSEELAELTQTFVLRRTSEILAQYLPPKTETVLFCRPTTTQASIYRTVLTSPTFGAVLNSPEASLQLINLLKKLCNSPTLIKRSKLVEEDAKDSNNSDSSTKMLRYLLSDVPSSQLKYPGTSGKLQVLDSLLHTLRHTTSEKVVLVSHYTSTLDVLSNLLTKLSYTHLRLDGTTPSAKRQALVDQFNRTDAASCFVFLLSAKSGGAGLNLIGASRLILFDVDWNPSTDEQAMARIHRDGQKRHCRIYRLLVQGALDEKIYQRQLTKRGLADSVIDNKVSASSFTRENLRKLFELDERETCQTHELLGCECGGNGQLMDEGFVEVDEVVKVDSEGSKTKGETTKEGEGVLDLAEDVLESDDSAPNAVGKLVKASKIDVDAQERDILDQSKARNKQHLQMQALMKFRHIDAKRIDEGGGRGGAGKGGGRSGGIGNGEDHAEAEDALDDEVLLEVLRDCESRVGYIFTKTSS
ncbi:MAG: helicase [Alyxoria varia]|nr:MAG: helicase [Alyxoria varia]